MQSDVIAHSIPDAVRVSGATRTSIYEAMRDGRLPFRKLGRRTLIMRCDLEAWVKACPSGQGRSAPPDGTSAIKTANTNSPTGETGRRVRGRGPISLALEPEGTGN